MSAPAAATAPVRRVGPPPVQRREAIVLVLGAVLLGALVIGSRPGVFTPDTRPDLYVEPGTFLRSTVQAWVPGATGLGQGNFNAGAAPVAIVVWLIRSLGAPAWLAVRIWRLALLLVGAWGIRRYLGALFGHRLSVQARVLATAFWVANPYVIVSGSTTPILLPYALLPWTMLAFLFATRSPRTWRWPAAFGLAFFAQTGLNAGVVPFFQLLALPGHVAFARWAEGRSWRDLWRVVRRCAVASVAVSLYWLLPSFLAAGTGAGIAQGTENPIDVARTSSYAEAARLLGNWPLYGRAGDRLFLGGYTIYLTGALVAVATFLVPVAVGLGLWRSRAKERLLVVGLLATALPVMVGLFPPDDRYPAGSLLLRIFEEVPATLAFRTTNKVGAVVVLGETIGLVLAWRAWQHRANQRRRRVRALGVSLAAALLVVLSTPLWNGSLYPLGYDVPATWTRAMADLDATGSEARVFVLPGGSGGNYRWGMRSPDDLFPSMLDRPVAVRSTVVGRGDPAGNLLSAVDLAVGQGAAGDRGISTAARYLGADQVLIRNDLLTEEIGGPPPSRVTAQAEADQALHLDQAYGRAGTDTIPGASGRPTRKQRRASPADASVRPLLVYGVDDPIAPVRLADEASQVLVVGDGDALVPLANEGIVDGRQPIRLLGDLDVDDLRAALRRGGRIVVTDTNRRRAWDINRTANATSPTLRADEDIDEGSGSTTTRWPDQPDDQSVSELSGGYEIGADLPDFGLQPSGRPSDAFDANPTTAWMTGRFHTAAGDSIWIDLPKRQRIEHVVVTAADTEPSSVSVVRVRVGDKQVIEAVEPGVPLEVGIQPSVADRVEVTILDQTDGYNPVGLSEVQVEAISVRNVTRVPTTLTDLARGLSRADRARLAATPLDVVFERARGVADDPGDDEEASLERRFRLPDRRTFTFEADLGAAEIAPEVLAAARAGEADCERVAVLDGEWVRARITSTRSEIADGHVHLEGCDPVRLGAGRHDLLAAFGWRLDRVHLASGADRVAAPRPAGTVEVLDRTPTHLVLAVPASDVDARLLRLGEAWDPRWRLQVDGRDVGEPMVIDGYSSGWELDGAAHELEVDFAPQRAVSVSFVASMAGLVGVTAVAVLAVDQAGSAVPRWRRRDDAVAGAPPSGGSDDR